MLIKGIVIKYDRENINTDEIIPARYLNTSDPDQLASHCMEDLDKDFIEKKNKMNAEILVTGANMGCGSSREHAPIAIHKAGISAVIAPSFARIFFRNSINMGLPIFECKERKFFKEIKEGNVVAINADDGYLENVTKGKKYNIQAIPEFLQKIINAGGLVPFARQNLK